MKKRQIIIPVAVAIAVLARLASIVIDTPPEHLFLESVKKVNTGYVDTVALSETPLTIASTLPIEAIAHIALKEMFFQEYFRVVPSISRS